MFQNDCQTSNKAMSFIDTLKKLIIIRALYLWRKYCRGEDEQQLQCPRGGSVRSVETRRPVAGVPHNIAQWSRPAVVTRRSDSAHVTVSLTTTTINRDKPCDKQCFSLCC